MNHSVQNGNLNSFLTSTFRFKGFDVSWAGPHPFEPGFCFGSDDGRLLFTDEHLTLKPIVVNKQGIGIPLANGSGSGEAINGVAGWGRCLAVTTRQDVTLWTLPRDAEGKIERVEFAHGAHDILATAGGHFLAPLGRTGLMFLEPPFSEAISVLNWKIEALDFYRVVSLQSAPDREVFACAARSGGIAVADFQPNQQSNRLWAFNFDGLDVVDVCSVGEGREPLAFAALGRDGTIYFFRNALTELNPTSLKFEGVQGTAYRLLSCRDHLFLLTSNGLYILTNLVNRFLRGEGFVGVQVLPVPLEAVDANLCHDRWLMLLMPNEVRKLDVSLLQNNIHDFKEMQPKLISPTWRTQQSEQGRTEVLATSA